MTGNSTDSPVPGKMHKPSVERKIRVYLDNCAYNRPYDDQSQARIELETQAKLKIQRLIKNEQIELASSYMSLYECGENPDQNKAALITDFINNHSSAFVSLGKKEQVEQEAAKIMETGIKFKDACHIDFFFEEEEGDQ